MHHFLDTFFGPHATSHSITVLQMTTRAVLVFFAALALLRVSGQRTFGGHNTFDVVVKIMLGAILSRAVVAASPFGATLVASFSLVLLHRLLAWACFYSPTIGRLVKGQARVLARHGQLHHDNLRRTSISAHDLAESLRENGGVQTLEQAQVVTLERSGSISIVLHPNTPPAGR